MPVVDTAPEAQFGVTDEELTGLAGLVKYLGLAEALAELVRVKRRRRGWRDDQMLLSLGYSFRAGGGHLNEVDALGADPVVGRGAGLRAVPDSRRLGEYLGRLLGAGSGPVPGSGQQAAEADRTVGRERCVPRTKWMQ